MKILIIGANSILSKQLILQHTNDEVNIVYKTRPSYDSIKSFPISKINQIPPDYDIVYIVSAVITNDITKTDDIYDINIKLIQSICNKFLHSKIIFFSSVAVYDAIQAGIIDEETLPSPQSVYGISKLWGEKIIEQHPKYGIIRISSMYGNEMKESTFLPKIIKSAIQENNIKLLGGGTRIQNYINVKDVALLANKLALYNENINILGISPSNQSNKEVARIIKKITNCTISFKGHDTSRSVEYKQSNHLLYQQNFTTLEQGIKELIQWKIKQY
ncbi:NAD(P)-dependent oxidoreductase [Chryseobacterium sp.]|uniref:NAD-dependent epimerase/dehydratase family protein n=1 Tax=Chryseobacterium sp. TaxID=1871047 RepID=UPI00261E9DD3|nr:NAD(P)-dependent oxidoreductase [Chryseobacterium sp.]